ncbi:MAG: hypothetical protein ACRENE_07810 [Polyangiaceae bacterium]
MRASYVVSIALLTILAACGDRSTLDALGGAAAGPSDDAGYDPQPAFGADAPPFNDAPTAGEAGTAAPTPGGDASDVAVGMVTGDAATDAVADAQAPLSCLARPALDCACPSCRTPSAVLNSTVSREAVANCSLSCLYNYFSFDENGCLTAYKPSPGFPSDDACILKEFAQVRVPCAAGLSQPLAVYHSCTVM